MCFVNKRRPHYNVFFPKKSVIGAIDLGAVQAYMDMDGQRELCLIDTGAAVPLLKPRSKESLEAWSTAFRTVGEHGLIIEGVTERTVRVGGKTVKQNFVISRDTNQTILGADFLRRLGL